MTEEQPRRLHTGPMQAFNHPPLKDDFDDLIRDLIAEYRVLSDKDRPAFIAKLREAL